MVKKMTTHLNGPQSQPSHAIDDSHGRRKSRFGLAEDRNGTKVKPNLKQLIPPGAKVDAALCINQIGGNKRMKEETSKQFGFVLELFHHCAVIKYTSSTHPSESCHQRCTLPRMEDISACYCSATLSRTLRSLAVGYMNGWPVALHPKGDTRTSGRSRTQSFLGYSKYPRGSFHTMKCVALLYSKNIPHHTRDV